MKKCTRCGFENFDEAYLCRKCGSKLKKKKNKSLDLDIQNSSPSGRNYSNGYQNSYTQQTYQGQTYDPYAQQQYQQQYQANQTYQNTYYDTYQGQQYQQNDYQQYQGQQYQQNDYQQYQGQQYQQNNYQQYQGQQYQQAQSQNRGNADSGVEGNQYNSDQYNSDQYNSDNYDNSYANDYQGSQADFTDQNVYGNDFNNNNNNSYNDNSYNNTNSDYNSDYNSSADSNGASFGDSFNDNSFAGNPQQIPFDPQQFMSNGGKPHVEFTETHNGNRHSFTMTSTTVSPLGGSEIPIPNLDETLDQFKNMAMQHIRPNLNKSRTSENQFSQKEYTNSARIAEDKLNKPRRLSIVAIVVLVLIVAIGGAIVYSSTNNSTAGKNNLFGSSSSVDLTIADKTYDLQGDKDTPYRVSFKLPKGYSLETEHFSDSHINFSKNSNDTQSTKQDNDDKATEPAVSGSIFILNESADSKVDEHNKTFPKNSGFDCEVNNIETPLGKMAVISIEGAGHYFYHGYVSLGTNHCLSVNTTTTDKKSKDEAYQALVLIAHNIAESSNYTFEITDESYTLTAYDNNNIQVKIPLFKDYHNPVNTDAGSAVIYERSINEETVLSYAVRINYQEANKVIEENFSAEKFAEKPISKLKSTEQVDTTMGKMTLITYENGYQNYIGIIPIDDNHSIQISVTNVREEHVDEAKAILNAIAQHGELTK